MGFVVNCGAMKNLSRFLPLVICLAWVLSCSSEGQVQVEAEEQAPVELNSALLTPYIEAQEALAGDDLEKAKDALGRLAEASGEELSDLARKAAQAEDIDAVRSAFKPLSEYAAQQKFPDEVRVAYCPMLDARWLQKDGEIANPYYGSSMLTCGRFEKKE